MCLTKLSGIESRSNGRFPIFPHFVVFFQRHMHYTHFTTSHTFHIDNNTANIRINISTIPYSIRYRSATRFFRSAHVFFFSNLYHVSRNSDASHKTHPTSLASFFVSPIPSLMAYLSLIYTSWHLFFRFFLSFGYAHFIEFNVTYF